MRDFTLSLCMALLLGTFTPLAAQFDDPPNVYPGSFTGQLNLGLGWPTGLEDAYVKADDVSLLFSLQLQRRIPIGKRLALRAGVGYTIYLIALQSDAGPAACRLFGPDCVIPPQPLNVNLITDYLALPVDLEIRFPAPTEKLYLVLNHTLLINTGARVNGAELTLDNSGEEINRYAGEVEARRVISQLSFGLGLRSSRDASLPAYLELGPAFTLGKVNKDVPVGTSNFRTNYARPTGVAGIELRVGLHF